MEVSIQVSLERASQEELLIELERRGWEIVFSPKPAVLVDRPISAMTGEEFSLYVEQKYGVKLRYGRLSMGILRALLEHYPNAVRYEAIIAELYGNDPNGGPLHAMGCLKSTVSRHRSLLKGTPFSIETIWGTSYRLVVDREALAS